MKGKEKCALLKKIRAMIARENGIPYETEECTAKGPCKGYCPKCDEEIQTLNQALQEKEAKKAGSVKVPKKSKKKLAFNGKKHKEKRAEENKNLSESEKRMSELEQAIATHKAKFSALKEELEKLKQEKSPNEARAECVFSQMKQTQEILKSLEHELAILQQQEIYSHQTMGEIAYDPEQEETLRKLMEEMKADTFSTKKNGLLDNPFVEAETKQETYDAFEKELGVIALEDNHTNKELEKRQAILQDKIEDLHEEMEELSAYIQEARQKVQVLREQDDPDLYIGGRLLYEIQEWERNLKNCRSRLHKLYWCVADPTDEMCFPEEDIMGMMVAHYQPTAEDCVRLWKSTFSVEQDRTENFIIAETYDGILDDEINKLYQEQRQKEKNDRKQ